MYRIRTYNAISKKGLGRISPEKYSLGPEVENPHAFILRSKKLHDEPIPKALVAVARAGAGYNNIPVDDMTRRGVVVFNTPGANANAVKELVIGVIFLGSRVIFGGI
jgi:D-3-phosphoglycerate dehydrogenase